MLEAERAVLGGVLPFCARLLSTSDKPQPLIIDYAVHHMKARTLAPRAVLEVQRNHKLAVVTTRRYHPGLHRVELLINGQSFGVRDFDLEVKD